MAKKNTSQINSLSDLFMLAGDIPSVREPLTSISTVDEDIASSGEAVAEVEALLSFRYGKRKISQSLQSIRFPGTTIPKHYLLSTGMAHLAEPRSAACRCPSCDSSYAK